MDEDFDDFHDIPSTNNKNREENSNNATGANEKQMKSNTIDKRQKKTDIKKTYKGNKKQQSKHCDTSPPPQTFEHLIFNLLLSTIYSLFGFLCGSGCGIVKNNLIFAQTMPFFAQIQRQHGGNGSAALRIYHLRFFLQNMAKLLQLYPLGFLLLAEVYQMIFSKYELDLCPILFWLRLYLTLINLHNLVHSNFDF